MFSVMCAGLSSPMEALCSVCGWVGLASSGHYLTYQGPVWERSVKHFIDKLVWCVHLFKHKSKKVVVLLIVCVFKVSLSTLFILLLPQRICEASHGEALRSTMDLEHSRAYDGQFAEEYQPLKAVGKGAFGFVWRALRRCDGQEVREQFCWYSNAFFFCILACRSNTIEMMRPPFV